MHTRGACTGAFQAATTVRAKRKRQAAAGEKPVTRTASITIGLTLALSLSAWLFFYIWTPSAPLTPRETMVIVGLCFGAVLGVSNARAASSRRDAKARRIHARREAEQGVVSLPLRRSPARHFVPPLRSPSTAQHCRVHPIGSSARPGESLRVRVWHAAAGSQAFRYSWSVDGGHIEGTGRDVAWTFGSVRPGYYKATVQIAEAIGAAAECSVRVVVVAADGSRGFETTRALLAPSETEDPAFGSVQLPAAELARQAPRAIRQRYLSAITSYLTLIRDSEEFLKHFERRELNITYVPVTERPQGLVGAEWVLEHYDYARGRRLLRAFRPDVPVEAGPVLASSLSSVSRAATVRRPLLYQDLSMVPPHVVSAWVHLFINQAAQERFEQTNKLDQLVLNLRGAIGILAESVPDIVDGLKTSIRSFAEEPALGVRPAPRECCGATRHVVARSLRISLTAGGSQSQPGEPQLVVQGGHTSSIFGVRQP